MKGIWKTLGIEATTDEKEIKEAFSKKSKETHPEDDSEGFLELRKAYQAALRYARVNQSGYKESSFQTTESRTSYWKERTLTSNNNEVLIVGKESVDKAETTETIVDFDALDHLIVEREEQNRFFDEVEENLKGKKFISNKYWYELFHSEEFYRVIREKDTTITFLDVLNNREHHHLITGGVLSGLTQIQQKHKGDQLIKKRLVDLKIIENSNRPIFRRKGVSRAIFIALLAFLIVGVLGEIGNSMRENEIVALETQELELLHKTAFKKKKDEARDKDEFYNHIVYYLITSPSTVLNNDKMSKEIGISKEKIKDYVEKTYSYSLEEMQNQRYQEIVDMGFKEEFEYALATFGMPMDEFLRIESEYHEGTLTLDEVDRILSFYKPFMIEFLLGDPKKDLSATIRHDIDFSYISSNCSSLHIYIDDYEFLKSIYHRYGKEALEEKIEVFFMKYLFGYLYSGYESDLPYKELGEQNFETRRYKTKINDDALQRKVLGYITSLEDEINKKTTDAKLAKIENKTNQYVIYCDNLDDTDSKKDNPLLMICVEREEEPDYKAIFLAEGLEDLSNEKKNTIVELGLSLNDFEQLTTQYLNEEISYLDLSKILNEYKPNEERFLLVSVYADITNAVIESEDFLRIKFSCESLGIEESDYLSLQEIYQTKGKEELEKVIYEKLYNLLYEIES